MTGGAGYDAVRHFYENYFVGRAALPKAEDELEQLLKREGFTVHQVD
jgi:hypothetical protein